MFMKRIPLVLVMSILILAGCSLKADRSSCPCWFELDLSNVDSLRCRSLEVYLSNGYEFVHKDRIESSHFGEPYELMVPRDSFGLNISSGAGHCRMDDGSILIPYGEECPYVYMYVRSFGLDCESHVETVTMRKNHCAVTVIPKKSDITPCELTMKGSVDGYEPDGSPHSGSFSFSGSFDEGAWTVVIPRQNDPSLVLEVNDRTGVLKTFAVGEYFDRIGYDWKSQDLQDVTLELDYTLSKINVIVNGWKETYVFDVII